jgi:hypothetical protein
MKIFNNNIILNLNDNKIIMINLWDLFKFISILFLNNKYIYTNVDVLFNWNLYFFIDVFLFIIKLYGIYVI